MSEPAPKPNILRKILHTFATLAFGQGSSIAAGIATAHAYGPSGKGILALAMILLTFGVTTADGVRNAVAYQVGPEKRDPRDVWGTALRLMACIAPVGIIVFLALWKFGGGNLAFLFAAVAFPFALYVQAVGVLYQLGDKVEKINVQNAATIGGGISMVTLVIVALFHAPVSVVLWTTAGAYAAAALWGMSGVRALIGGSGNLRAAGLLREQIVFGSKVALTSNVTLLALRVDVFIVGALLSPASLGIYTLALATGEVLYNVSRSVLWSVTGQIATAEFEESAALCARIVRSIVAMQFFVAVAMFVAGPWLITHVYGARFAESGNVLRLFLPGIIFYSADGLFSYFISVKSGRPAGDLAHDGIRHARPHRGDHVSRDRAARHPRGRPRAHRRLSRVLRRQVVDLRAAHRYRRSRRPVPETQRRGQSAALTSKPSCGCRSGVVPALRSCKTPWSRSS